MEGATQIRHLPHRKNAHTALGTMYMIRMKGFLITKNLFQLKALHSSLIEQLAGHNARRE
jgi:hypothetical protein